MKSKKFWCGGLWLVVIGGCEHAETYQPPPIYRTASELQRVSTGQNYFGWLNLQGKFGGAGEARAIMSTLEFKVTDLAGSDFEGQVTVEMIIVAGINEADQKLNILPRDIFYCNHETTNCGNPTAEIMGRIDGKVASPAGVPRLFQVDSDEHGHIFVTLSSDRLKADGTLFKPFSSESTFSPVFVLLRARRTSDVYIYGGAKWFNPRGPLLSGNALINDQDQGDVANAKQMFEFWFKQWQESHKKPAQLLGDTTPFALEDEYEPIPWLGRPCEFTPDSDGDGVDDEADACPFDRDKLAPGLCGCGGDDYLDSDQDGTPDCLDSCPTNTWVKSGPCVSWGDADSDGDVDQSDFAAFQICLGSLGLDEVLTPDCRPWDADRSGVIDQIDYAKFRACESGPAIPASCQ